MTQLAWRHKGEDTTPAEKSRTVLLRPSVGLRVAAGKKGGIIHGRGLLVERVRSPRKSSSFRGKKRNADIAGKTGRKNKPS